MGSALDYIKGAGAKDRRVGASCLYAKTSMDVKRSCIVARSNLTRDSCLHCGTLMKPSLRIYLHTVTSHLKRSQSWRGQQRGLMDCQGLLLKPLATQVPSSNLSVTISWPSLAARKVLDGVADFARASPTYPEPKQSSKGRCWLSGLTRSCSPLAGSV